MNEEAKGRVLVGSELHFHSPELNPPSDMVVNWYFEAHWVPVGPIEHFKKDNLLLTHILEVVVDNQEVSSENVGQMKDHLLVHFDFIFFSYLFYEVYVLLSDSSMKIIVFRTISLVIPYVIVCWAITRGRNKVIMLRIPFIWSSIIRALTDNTPSHIHIRHFSFEKRTACC